MRGGSGAATRQRTMSRIRLTPPISTATEEANGLDERQGLVLRLVLPSTRHGENQQPSEQPPNDFGLSDFERPIQSKSFVLMVPGGGVEPP